MKKCFLIKHLRRFYKQMDSYFKSFKKLINKIFHDSWVVRVQLLKKKLFNFFAFSAKNHNYGFSSNLSQNMILFSFHEIGF